MAAHSAQHDRVTKKLDLSLCGTVPTHVRSALFSISFIVYVLCTVEQPEVFDIRKAQTEINHLNVVFEYLRCPMLKLLAFWRPFVGYLLRTLL